MHRLILAVFDFMALTRRYARLSSNRQFELLFEIAIQQELYAPPLSALFALPLERLGIAKPCTHGYNLIGRWIVVKNSHQDEGIEHHMMNILDAAFAHSRGPLGRLGGLIMGRSTDLRNEWTLSLLNVEDQNLPMPEMIVEAASFPAGTREEPQYKDG